MTPWTKSPQPLLQFTILRWGSTPRSRHAFQIQRYLSNGPIREEERLPYHFTSRHLPRKVLLGRLRFPREDKHTLSKIWWATKHTPKLLYALVNQGVRFLYRRIRNPRPPEERGGVVKSRIGRLFYEFVRPNESRDLLNLTMQPWGYFHNLGGQSMQPTLGGNGAILYSSYAYLESQDIRLGDVVCVISPDHDKEKATWCKRVAALGEKQILVDPGRSITKYILPIPMGHCFVLGDNDGNSSDSRQRFAALPIESIWTKCRWACGQDGFQWVRHNQYPWEKSKIIEHLAPGQNLPAQIAPLIKRPKKFPIISSNPNAKPQPTPVKKKRTDPRKKF